MMNSINTVGQLQGDGEGDQRFGSSGRDLVAIDLHESRPCFLNVRVGKY